MQLLHVWACNRRLTLGRLSISESSRPAHSASKSSQVLKGNFCHITGLQAAA